MEGFRTGNPLLDQLLGAGPESMSLEDAVMGAINQGPIAGMASPAQKFTKGQLDKILNQMLKRQRAYDLAAGQGPPLTRDRFMEFIIQQVHDALTGAGGTKLFTGLTGSKSLNQGAQTMFRATKGELGAGLQALERRGFKTPTGFDFWRDWSGPGQHRVEPIRALTEEEVNRAIELLSKIRKE